MHMCDGLIFSLCLFCWCCRCKGNARYVLLGAFNYAGLLVIGSVYLLWKMRDARRQVRVLLITCWQRWETLLYSVLVIGICRMAPSLTAFPRILLLVLYSE